MPTIEVETDHKPLKAIIKKPFHQAPVRFQKMILSVQKHSINVLYHPGKQLAIADAPSRAYLPNQSEGNTSLEFEENIVSTLLISTPKLQSMMQCDLDLQHLMQLTENGWPDHKSKVPSWCSP